MGNSASKAAKTAAQASKRQYPTRIPATPAPKVADPNLQPPQGPQVHSTVQANEAKTEEISRDSFDPQFGAALRSLGPVRPSPTQSNSSTAQAQPSFESGLGGNQPVFPDPKNNPALIVLEARKRFGQLADSEVEQYGRRGFGGKQLLDISVIRQILVMRDQQGKSDAEIERSLEIHPGTVGKITQGVTSMPDTSAIRPVRR